MTDPNTTPSHNDEDRHSAPPAPDLGQPTELSNAMELGGNPDEFFKVRIDDQPAQHQPVEHPVTTARTHDDPEQHPPPPFADQDRQDAPSNGSAAPTVNEASLVGLPPAAKGPNDFFDQSGRTAAPGVFTSQPQALPPEERQPPPGYSFDTFLDGANHQQPVRQARSNDPYAFFESGGDGTVSGSTPGFAHQNPVHPNVYSGGLTAEQAFFFGGANAPDQQPKAPQPDSTFQSFYQTANAPQQEVPSAQPQPQHEANAQQPDGWGPAHLPAAQPIANPVQRQAPNSSPPEVSPPPSTSFDQVEERPKRAEMVPLKSPPPNNKPSFADPPPKPQRRRFSAPDKDDDKGNDYSKASEPQQFPGLDKLITPETTGILRFALHQIMEILKAPKEFFSAMPLRGNIAEPALFLVICAVGSGLLAGFINFNLIITFQFVIGSILAALMLSFSAWKCYGMMGSVEPFEANFRVIAYSQAALIIAGIQLNFLGTPIPSYLTLFISIVLSMRLQLIGMAVVHQDLPRSKLFLVLILTTVFIMVVRLRLFLI